MPKSECPDLQLHPDEPIVDAKADALNRAKLAESIASKVLSRDAESCMVVGISGPWGSGKSSLLNLIEERFHKAADEKSGILVLRFNPWRYGSVEELIAGFLGEMRRVVGLINKEKLADDISKALDRMAIALLALSAVPSLQPAALFSAGAKTTSKLIKSLIRKESLEKIKADLSGYLQEAGVHLVILIDDLDRAEPECVRLMLQMIRMNADFSNTTYVLAYDRERTARALSSSLGIGVDDGRDYLGKLVQVPFDLPILESLRLKVEVADAALPLFEMIFEEPDLARRHQEMINAHFYELFESVRDAKRFANALAVTMPLVWDEVNAVDFAVLEALRLRHPQFHAKLHEHKWLLLNEAGGIEEVLEDYLLRDKQPDREGHQKALEGLLGFVRGKESQVRSLLEALFPQLSRLQFEQSTWRLPANVAWSRQRLVCSTDHFDSYFFLAPGIQSVSEIELNEALSLGEAKDREALGKTLVEMDKRGKGAALMRRISMQAPDLTQEQLETVIIAFLDVSSDPTRWGYPTQDPSPVLQIGFYMANLVSSIEDDDRRLAVIDRCIQSGAGLCGVARFTSSVLDMTFKGQPVVVEARKPDVSAAACARIQKAAEANELLDSPCATSLLYRWLEWEPQQAKEYVRSHVQDESSLRQLLGSLRRTAGRYSDASGYEEPSPQLLPKILNYIVNIDVVNEASETAEGMLKKSADTEETEILNGFIEGAAALTEEKAAEKEQKDV